MAGRAEPQLGGEVMKGVTAVCQGARCEAIEILPGKAVIEIKPSGYDKGTGLREMMTHLSASGGSVSSDWYRLSRLRSISRR